MPPRSARLGPDVADQVFGQGDLRQALGRFATGVAVVTTRSSAGRNEGVTVNSFAAVSLDPPLVLWSLRRDSSTLPVFLASGHFAIHVLASEQVGLSRHFAMAGRDKFAKMPVRYNAFRSPLLSGCLAVFECTTESLVEGGDHVILVGRVRRLAYRDGEPLVFSAGCYRALAAPETDPLSSAG